MPDPRVNSWRFKGSLYVWRYKERVKDYPGWNVSADTAGCLSIIELLETMRSSRWSSKKVMGVTRSRQTLLRAVNNRGGKAAWSSPGTITLHYLNELACDKQWNITSNNSGVVFVFGKNMLCKLLEAFGKIGTCDAEFAVDSPDNEHFKYSVIYLWPAPIGT